eukprot:6214837-Pleurochrysis_carterae.AAC.11
MQHTLLQKLFGYILFAKEAFLVAHGSDSPLVLVSCQQFDLHALAKELVLGKLLGLLPVRLALAPKVRNLRAVDGGDADGESRLA